MAEQKMVAPESDVKMVRPDGKVKIRVVRPIRIDETVLQPGTVAMVNEDDAKEFCDRVFQGSHAFIGERHDADGDVKRHELKRAVRL